MATNTYITLDSKKYIVLFETYKPVISKRQTIDETVGGKTRYQTFPLTEKRWEYTLNVPDVPASGYGSIADLKAAYAKDTVGFTNHDTAETFAAVFLMGEFLPRPIQPVLGTTKYLVDVVIREHVT